MDADGYQRKPFDFTDDASAVRIEESAHKDAGARRRASYEHGTVIEKLSGCRSLADFAAWIALLGKTAAEWTQSLRPFGLRLQW